MNFLGVKTCSKEEFERHVRAVTASTPGPCPYDLDLQNIRNSPQGNFGLVMRDLRAVFPEESDGSKANDGVSEDVRFIEETCRSAGVHNAFHLRRELVNLKKVCQHILEDAKQTERELKQLTTFYYNDIVQTDREGFYHSKRYADISDKMKQCQGSTQTILDMRGFLKAICCVPRHADGDRPRLLANLPFSLKSYKMLSRSESYANGLSEDFVGGTDLDGKQKELLKDCIFEMPSPEPWELTEELLQQIRPKRPQWPPHIFDYLKALFLARGVTKALWIVAEAEIFTTHLKKMHDHVRKMLDRFTVLGVDAEARAQGTRESGGVTALSAVNPKATVNMVCTHFSKTNMHLKMLIGCADVMEIMHECLVAIMKTPNRRWFVAGDRSSSNQAAIYAPEGFSKDMANICSIGKDALETHLPSMFNDMEAEGWPPQEDKRPGVTGRCECRRCKHKFGAIWIHPTLRVCRACENVLRRPRKTAEMGETPLACPFATLSCRLPSAFCPHFERCFCCDGWSCAQCRMIRGDGDDVVSVVEGIVANDRAHLGGIFLDFDRTFASTKCGGSPMPKELQFKRGGGKPNGLVIRQCSGSGDNTGGGHTLDNGLLNLAMAYPDLVHIVTRNSHVEDIRAFISGHGILDSVSIRSVKREKTTKGKVIKTLLEERFASLQAERGGELKGPIIGVFADDDIREHFHDDMLHFSRNAGGSNNDTLSTESNFFLERILFVRGVKKRK